VKDQATGSSDYSFKLHLVGDSGVGKSSLLLRYVDDNYVEYPVLTIGVDFKTKKFYVADKTVELQIWDSALPECMRAAGNKYYQRADAIIFVVDPTDETSFESVAELKKNREIVGENTICFLVAAKWDKQQERKVGFETITAYAKTNDFRKVFFTSAKTGDNVEEAFDEMAEIISKEVQSTTALEVQPVQPSLVTKGFFARWLPCCFGGSDEETQPLIKP
jgi:small GTP-binding protein